MPKTAIGLFENPDLVDAVVREIEVLGFPRKEVRTQEEPATFEVTGVMSFPRLDFEVDLIRELTRSGRPKQRRGLTSKDCSAEGPWYVLRVRTRRWTPLRIS